MKRCINAHLKTGETVYDPFMGSGTTAVAAFESGFNFLGTEIDKETFELSKERLRQ